MRCPDCNKKMKVRGNVVLKWRGSLIIACEFECFCDRIEFIQSPSEVRKCPQCYTSFDLNGCIKDICNVISGKTHVTTQNLTVECPNCHYSFKTINRWCG